MTSGSSKGRNASITRKREVSVSMKEKRDRNWERVLETFKTGRYPNEGAYGSIPTIRGNLMKKVHGQEPKK